MKLKKRDIFVILLLLLLSLPARNGQSCLFVWRKRGTDRKAVTAVLPSGCIQEGITRSASSSPMRDCLSWETPVMEACGAGNIPPGLESVPFVCVPAG